MFHTVLMATDLSPASDAMVRCARALQQLDARHIVLFHALGLRHLQDMAPRLQEQVEPRLQEQASSLRAQGFEVSPEVAPGVAMHEVVSRCPRGGDCSLIVMAATSDSVARMVVLGSTTTHVLHDATCPVLVLHLKPRQEGAGDRCEVVCGELLGHVLFATDFSDAAERAFQVLEELSDLGVRRVTLLHVQSEGRIRAEDRSRLEEFDRIDRSRLERLREALTGRGVKQVDIQIPFGSPAREIAAASEADDVTLVVLGTQGRGFFGELLLGGVAHQVARRASVPTLLVPPKLEALGGSGQA